MSRILGSVGRFCAQHRGLVLGIWLILAAGFILALATIGPKTNNDLTLPGTGSQAASDLLAEEFPPQQNGASPIVFHVDSGQLTDSALTQAIQDSIAAVRQVPHVYSAPDPTANPAAGLISDDGQTAFSSVLLDISTGELTTDIAQAVIDATEPAQQAGIAVEAGGPIGSTLSTSTSEASEVIGILAAMIILTLTFGSLVAMGMPIVMAIAGLIVGLGIVGMLGHVINIASTGPTLAIMIGLGVGIDYALFLVTRHRDNLRAGMPIRESIATAVATSGGAVVFAGGTVMIALLALGVAGIPLVTSLGYATAIAVFTAVSAAITFLPALLSLVGPRINSARLPRWLHPPPKPEGQGLWAHWASFVTRYRFVAVLIALAILIPLALPLFSLNLGQEDIGVTPQDTTERKAFDLMSEGFGPGYNGPLLIAVSLNPPAAPSSEYTAQYNLATALGADLTNKQTQLTYLGDSLTAQQDQLEQQQADLESQAAELQQEQGSLENEGAQLEQEADSLQDEEADLEQAAAELQDEAAGARQQEADLRAEQAALVGEARQLRQERDSLLQRREALQAEADRLVQVLIELERQQAALTTEIAQLEAIIANPDSTPEEVAAAQARLLVARAELGDVQAAIAATQAQLQQVRTEAEQLLNDAAALVAQAESLEQQSEQLRAQADATREEEGALVQQAASLAGQARDLQQEGAQLQAEASDLQQQGAQLQQQGDELQAQGDALQQQGNALQAEADLVTQEATDTQAEGTLAQALQTQLTSTLTTVAGDNRGTDPRLVALKDALLTPDGITLVSPANISTSGEAATFTVIPDTRPAAQETADLVVQMRESVIPPALGSGVVAYVGGNTAANVDLASKIARQLPLVIGTIIGLSFLLLMVAFRSLLIPVQAAVTNLLSAAAAFGVVTACFQWGWGLGLVNLPSPYGTVPIASYVPLMMFAALFGLSMDYEVFFASQVQHHHAEGDSVRTAVRRGLANSARVIVAAALIMISVFGSFILEPDPTIKQFGVGLSVAVFLAGLMVILLAPAMLALFGERTFWVPGWLGRILPHVDLEGPPPTAPHEVSTAEIPHAVGARGDGHTPATVEIPEPRVSDSGPRHRAD